MKGRDGWNKKSKARCKEDGRKEGKEGRKGIEMDKGWKTRKTNRQEAWREK